MVTQVRFSDFDHPSIINLAARLTERKPTTLEKAESLFSFIRDEIKFGFTPKWDEIKASDVLYYRIGYCNTKATLFVALCRAAGIDARVHFGLIDLRIMHGIMPGFAFPFLPKLGSHSWSEILLDGQWKPIDSYINDRLMYQHAIEQLKRSGRTIGYSVAYKDGKSSCEFNFGSSGFVHMGVVREDHGAWDDPADYFSTDLYIRFNRLQALAYPWIAIMSNRNVERIRQSKM